TSKRHNPTDKEDLAVPWTCEEVDQFTPRIRNFKSLRKTRMPNSVKTYDGTGDPEDHMKIFQAATQVERWAMPTWCHMFNSTLIGAARVWFDELPPESIDGYKDLKAAFLAYFMHQKKYVKDPMEIHNIKKRNGETIEDFMERFKVESGRMKGAPKCMRISEFMHGVNNPELTKRLNEHVLKDHGRNDDNYHCLHTRRSRRHFQKERSHIVNHRTNPSGMFKSGNLTSELKKQIEELVRAGKLSHLIKEIKQGRDQPKVGKKEVPTKDKSMAIYMVQPWHRMTRQKVTQSFAYVSEITFLPLTTSSGTEGPLFIEAEIGGHMIHRMYVDGGSSTEWRNYMATGTTIWPLGQLRLLATILIPTECATVTTLSKEILKEAEVHHKNFKVALHPNFPDQEVAIGGTLLAKGRTKLCSLLKENLDIFAWQPSDITGVP
ncbi:reverse transcriptase domain-containing protein, partial [Tanacetum coccineum]